MSLTVMHPAALTPTSPIRAHPQGLDPALIREQTQAFNSLLRTPPEEAASLIVRAIERRDKRLLIGSDARMAERLQRLFPVNYWKYLNRWSP